MSTQESDRSYDSQSRRTSDNFALESSANDDRIESTHASLTTSSSSHPSLSLPAQGFSSPPTIQQPAHDFSLPVRGRYEPQIENRRVSIAAFGNSANGGSRLPTPDSGPWFSQESYQQAVAQFQARRSRSQPSRPGSGATYSQQQALQAQGAMRYAAFQSIESPTNKHESAFAPILPSPSSHFGQQSDFFSSSVYSPHLGTFYDCPALQVSAIDPLAGYDSMTALPDQSYFGGLQDQRPSTISPRPLPSSHSYGMSTPRTVSKVVSRSPPTRERTPIRHHRPSVSRARSGSRPEVLLAYVEQQQQQAATSIHMQSAPSTPPVYPPSAYSMPATTAPPVSHSGYYAAPAMPNSASQYLAAPSPYSSDPNQTSFFGLTRSVSQPTLDLSTLNPQDAMYLPNPNSIPSNSPPLPSLGSSLHSFPPPAASLESSPEGFRVLASRPKPQCFDHGCNGRQFSTFSNLLRHQREKSGSAMKAICPHCGTEFTRTTARNGHLWGGKCKGRGGDGQEGPNEEALSTTGSE